MTTAPISLSTEDYQRLRSLTASLTSRSRSAGLEKLLQELNRASIFDPLVLPKNIIRIGSVVEIEDVQSGEVDVYTLCMPDRADLDCGMLSVLAPIGTGILGYAEGDVIEWETPGGVRRLRVRSVSHPSHD